MLRMGFSEGVVAAPPSAERANSCCGSSNTTPRLCKPPAEPVITMDVASGQFAIKTSSAQQPADLAFQATELMAQCENLDPEVGLGLLALDQEVEEEADDAVQEAQKHGWDHGEQGRPAAAPTPCLSRLSSIPIKPRVSPIYRYLVIHANAARRLLLNTVDCGHLPLDDCRAAEAAQSADCRPAV
jgi:hypothetical protein